MTAFKKISILLGPGVFLALMLMGHPEDMNQSAYAVLAGTLWIAIWWVSETIPIPATSLLPLVLFPLAAGLDIGGVALNYSKPIIFIFLGGFLIALAMEKWNLHRRIALNIISITGTNMRQILLGFIAATGLLSMWISNTATTVMMLPIALSIISQYQYFLEESQVQIKGAEKFGKALVLGIAYSASIGGMATLIGTPTNLIFAESVKNIYDQEMAFDQWFMIGFPISVSLLGVCWWHLAFNAFSLSSKKVPGSHEIIRQQLADLGKMKVEEKWILAVFTLVAFAWMSRRYLINPLFPAVNDGIIVLIGALVLFFIPSKEKPNQRLMDWETTQKLPWGVILLFGGALAVAAAFSESGLTDWIGGKFYLLQGVPFWIILLVLVSGVNFLTEITQNIATCTLMMPIVASMAGVIDVHPYTLMVGTTIAASCAFMLPVATAPNAIVFGSGYIRMKDMIRTGFLLNILSIIIIMIFIYFIFPVIWDLDLLSFPDELK